ncbi:MAG: hypothetical protein KGL95_14750 [Patescibacteria group bacterium]|nr:hypothetical protein [Patescibacteria group bacterium]
MLKRKIQCSEEKITKGFTRAGEKIHKKKNTQGILSYMIMKPGVDHLKKLLNDHGVNVGHFAKFDDGLHNFFLLQVDLANHTKWFGDKKADKNHAKKELAMLFTNELKDKYEFDKLFWAGDGGIFVRTSEAAKNSDTVIDVADTIYELFGKWKKKYRKLETKLLNIRVSAHMFQIFTDSDPGFWTSEELNNFIKYERDMSEKGFAVTKQIRDLLTASKQKRFVDPVVEIPNREGTTVMQVYYDSTHRLK